MTFGASADHSIVLGSSRLAQTVASRSEGGVMHDSRVGVRRGWFVWGLVAVFAVVAASCASGGGGPTPAGPTATVTVGSETIQVSGPSGSVVAVVPSAAGSVPATPAGLVFPFGALHLEVLNVAVGAVTHVTVALQTRVDTFRKTIDGVWDQFTWNGTTGGTLSADGKTIDLDIVDGGRGDDDGVANGIIVDDLAGTNATALTITSNDIPLVLFGQSYSHQLVAAGAAGPVTWSVVSGTPPTGITLDASGLLSGSATDQRGSPVRVEATDGTTTVTKLLFVAVVSADSGGATSTNAPLPDGTSVLFATTLPCSANPCPPFWAARYSSDGTVTPISTLSINSLRTLQGNSVFVNPAGTRVITTVPAATPGPSTGPVEVIDGDTGAPITTLEPSPTFTVGGFSFSRNGAYLALKESNGSTRVFETTTWSVVRTFTGPAFGQLIWSPNSTEIAAANFSGPAAVTVTSVTTPANDRTVTIAGQSNCNFTDWSATNRLALLCNSGLVGGLVTASAVDGSDVRFVGSSNPNTCTALPCTLVAGFGAVFSPSGTHLAFGEATVTSFGPPMVVSAVALVVAPDTASAPATPIVTTDTTHFAIPLNWR